MIFVFFKVSFGDCVAVCGRDFENCAVKEYDAGLSAFRFPFSVLSISEGQR